MNLFDLRELPKDFVFPNEIGGSLGLSYLKELPEDIKLPSRIGESLYLNSLKKLPKNFKFPEIGKGIHLISLEELPDNIEFFDNFEGNLFLNDKIKLSDKQVKCMNKRKINIIYIQIKNYEKM